MEIQFTSDIVVRMIHRMGGDETVVAAARSSTDAEEVRSFTGQDAAETNQGLITYLMKNRRGEYFKHSYITFYVAAPLFVLRELSSTGLNCSEQLAKHLPPVFWFPERDRKMVPSNATYKSNKELTKLYDDQGYDAIVRRMQDSYRQSYNTYLDLLSADIDREVARGVLPMGIFTSFWMTCNPESLMAFLCRKTHDRSAKFVATPSAEIEQASKVVESVFKEGWPLTYKAFNDHGRMEP